MEYGIGPGKLIPARFLLAAKLDETGRNTGHGSDSHSHLGQKAAAALSALVSIRLLA